LIEPLLDRLPAIEADVLELTLVHHKKQQEIATMFGVTQAAISHRLKKAKQRITFLLTVPQLDEQEIRELLGDVTELTETDLKVIISMTITTCQQETSRVLDLAQNSVRYRFFKASRILTKKALTNKKYRPIAALLSAIIKQPGVMHDQRMPQWHDPAYQVREGDLV
jgi:predicted transcriptional regulator